MATIGFFRRAGGHFFVLPSNVAGAVEIGCCNPCGPVGLVPDAFAPAAPPLALAAAPVAATFGSAAVAGCAAGGTGGTGGGAGILGGLRNPITLLLQ